MALSFLGLMVAIFCLVSFFRKRHDRFQEETDERFWERESEANLVRRKDISGLSYINIPFEDFSIGVFSDEKLSEAEQHLSTFAGKKILNLTGLTNTDLKMQYGPANLPTLMECDQNFTEMLLALTDYSNCLIELNHMDEAIPVLEFCIRVGSDVSSHYTILGNYYKAGGQTAKLEELRDKASALNSLTKASLLQKLDHIISE